MASKGLTSMLAARRRLSITTWNVAAINNNPFEYWITVPDHPDYEKLMVDIEQFIEHPTPDQDVTVQHVFTQTMFEKLDQRLVNVGWKSVKSYWEEDYSKRRIISEFLKVSTQTRKTQARTLCRGLEADLKRRPQCFDFAFLFLRRTASWEKSDWLPCPIELLTLSMLRVGQIQFVDPRSLTCTMVT
jgi:hypothetical protein